MSLRPASAGDADALAALEAELFGVDAWSRDLVLSELEGSGRSAWVAVASDLVVGYAVTLRRDEVVDLQRIAVRASYRRSGVATALLDAALDRARRDGADRMLLEVSAANTGALAFYAAHGFVEIDRRRRYYRDGSDAVVMGRDLDTRTSG